MFTVDELLSKRNQRDAFAHFATKKDGCGQDQMRLSELEEYWKLNHEWIEQEIREGTYQPGVIKCYEILNGKGKKRIVSSLNVIDRFVTRLLSQKLKRYMEKDFLPCSYAYQDGKGIAEAVRQAQTYVEAGYLYVAEIDISNFFDEIPLDILMKSLQEKINDSAVLQLIKSYLYCTVSQEQAVKQKVKGLVQGNSISPILSNLYLHPLDQYMEKQGHHWIRFADDINIYAATQEEAGKILHEMTAVIQEQFHLCINEKKSGVYDVFTRRFLGYDFYKVHGKIEVRKHQYQVTATHHNWHPSVIQKVNEEYHVIQDGVLNKKDYALLFENEKEKHYIPVEAVEQLNIYAEVTLTSAALRCISEKKIRAAFFDKHDNLMGYYIPEGYAKSSFTVLRQCALYNEENERLSMAKKLEIAYIHNIRANVRYYNKKETNNLDNLISELSQYIVKINEADSVDNLMLLEARARGIYFHAFNSILECGDFHFVKRTKRPPEDELNAMISFGNTLLYHQFLIIIWKTSLDPRIGVVHAANRRNYSLNLDFADLFKPVIVDRTIFSLINCQRIKKEEHFEKSSNGGIYLNREGKKIFIESFERKLAAQIIMKGKKYTYRQLMEQEVRQFQKYLVSGEKYKPYKYY